MYYLNKIVGWALSPMGVFACACAAGMMLAAIGYGRDKARIVKSGAALVLSAFVWICSMGCGFMTRLIGVPLETPFESYRTMSVSGYPSADAICILGGGLGYHLEGGKPELFSGADRACMGAELYRSEKAARIILSGNKSFQSTAPILAALGVDTNCVVTYNAARNTEEESRLIAASGMTNILLVTSAWHMQRALMLFERAGLHVIAAPTDFEMSYAAQEPLKFSDFLPGSDAMSRNSVAIKEWVGLAGYSILGSCNK